jgi:predicted nucleic acid-binding protein
MAFVVDASVAMGWLLRSQADQYTSVAEGALLNSPAWIPYHFGIEILRSLRSQERRNLLTSREVDEAISRLLDFPLQQDADGLLEHTPTIVALARREGLRVADAGYLELALRLELPLATRDAALARAVERSGASLFSP